MKSAKKKRSAPHIKNEVANQEPPLCLNPSFFRFLPSPCTFKPFMLGLPCPLLDLFVMPPKGDGPWALDKVKQRLRAEQVDRERAAAARHRRQEERGERQETQSTAASSP